MPDEDSLPPQYRTSYVRTERPKVMVMCNYVGCQKSFYTTRANVSRSRRLKRKLYCSPSCACAAKNGTSPPQGNAKRNNLTPFRRSWKLALRRQPNNNLTLEHLKEVWDRQKGICPYTGWKLILPSNQGGFGEFSRSIRKASLDRIDSDRGYEIGNVQFISIMANYAKSDYTHEQMVEFCTAIAEKWKIVPESNPAHHPHA